jgi:hypothetical protein
LRDSWFGAEADEKVSCELDDVTESGSKCLHQLMREPIPPLGGEHTPKQRAFNGRAPDPQTIEVGVTAKPVKR